MNQYPMLADIDPERVSKVGGKAAILERILQKWPAANIPPFIVHDSPESFERQILPFPLVLRTSSELDVFGGCGLFDTYHNVESYNYTNLANNLNNWYESPDVKVRDFAKNIGIDYKMPTMISQMQGQPHYWVIVLQHPNNPNVHIINYSRRPSKETKKVSDKLFEKQTYSALCIDGKFAAGNLELDSHDKLVEIACMHHQRVDALGIIDNDWVSILESGISIFPDGTVNMEIYQFTPLRKKTDVNCDVNEQALIFGQCSDICLPVVYMPTRLMLKDYMIEKDTNYISQEKEIYPDDITKICDEIIYRHLRGKHSGPDEILNVLSDLAMDSYASFIDKKYNKGYLLLCEEGTYGFDINITKARAVIIDTHRGIEMLNHDISRMICKAPVLVMDTVSIGVPAGRNVHFSCNGSEYSIR
jgi:hypothetical protein